MADNRLYPAATGGNRGAAAAANVVASFIFLAAWAENETRAGQPTITCLGSIKRRTGWTHAKWHASKRLNLTQCHVFVNAWHPCENPFMAGKHLGRQSFKRGLRANLAYSKPAGKWWHHYKNIKLFPTSFEANTFTAMGLEVLRSGDTTEHFCLHFCNSSMFYFGSRSVFKFIPVLYEAWPLCLVPLPFCAIKETNYYYYYFNQCN